jgi:trimethylamine:corrinoid methyltransferase-like protein
MDEDICLYMQDISKQYAVTPDSLAVDSIIEAGSCGSYITRKETAKLCRNAFYKHKIFNKYDHAGWKKEGAVEMKTKTRKII